MGKGEKGALIGLGKVRGLMEVSALASAGKFVALTTSKVVKQWVDGGLRVKRSLFTTSSFITSKVLKQWVDGGLRACLGRQLSRALIEP